MALKKPKTLIFNKVSAKVTEIFLYGEIGWEVEDSVIVNQIINAGSKNNEIRVRINSLGGDVFQGIAIFNVLNSVEATIVVYIEGVAASIASVIAMAGDKILINKYARLMAHRSSGLIYGDTDDMTEAARLLSGVDADLADIYARRSGMSAEDVKAKYLGRGQQSWFNSKTAIENGFADEEYDGVKVAAKADDSGEILQEKFSKQLQIQTNNKMEKIIALLGLALEGTTEDQVVEAIKAIQAKAQNDEQAKTITKLENQIKTLHENRVETLITGALNAKKITADLKDHFTKLASDDFDTTKSVIDKMPVLQSITSQLQQQQKAEEGRESWTFDDYRKKAPADLASMKTDNPEKYNALFKAQFGKEPKS